MYYVELADAREFVLDNAAKMKEVKRGYDYCEKSRSL